MGQCPMARAGQMGPGEGPDEGLCEAQAAPGAAHVSSVPVSQRALRA